QRYFDVTIEYAKAAPTDILVRITATNRGPEAHALHVLPTLWFRNEWTWRSGIEPSTVVAGEPANGDPHVIAHQNNLGNYHLYAHAPKQMLYTENETNYKELWGTENPKQF